RHLDGCAMMRCLGASQARIMWLHVLHFTMLGSLAARLGMIVGIVAQAVLAFWLGEVVAVSLPLPGVVPALHGVLVGLLLLLGFALPPLVNLSQVPTLRVLRREIGLPGRGGVFGYALGGAVIGGLVLWRAEELRFGLTVLGWFVAAMVAACLLTWLALRVITLLRGQGGAWRFGIGGL